MSKNKSKQSNKKIIIIVIIVATFAAAVAYLLISGRQNEVKAPTNSSTQEQASQSQATGESATTTTAQAGSYEAYSAAKVSETTGQRVLFFHAPWCPQCRQLDASIQSSGVPAGVTIFKVDYDTNQALRQKYGVTLQTTLVLLDSNENAVKKFVAYDEPTMAAVESNLLSQ